MIAEDYYRVKVAEALEKADSQPRVSSCFVSIALVYRSLANDENKIHQRFPQIPPRHVERAFGQRPWEKSRNARIPLQGFGAVCGITSSKESSRIEIR